MPEIVNKQRKIKINKANLQNFANTAAAEISETNGRNFTVAFISDKRMRELNQSFRRKNSTTDVLSFPFEADEFEIESESADFAGDYLGDIVISAEQARKQSEENNLDFEIETKQLILHGILHLCGYDHETDNGEMNRRELKLREILKISG